MTEAVNTAVEELEALDEAENEQLAAISLEVARSRESYELALFDPIMVGAEKVTKLTFRPPSLGEIRKGNPSEEQITALLAGIHLEQVYQLSPYDYLATQAVMRGFRLRRANGGSARKS